jgi:hypothetical protein
VGHPLARRIIEACASAPLPTAELTFRYSTTPKKISILEPFVGSSGWLCLTNVSITSFETEDHVIFAGFDDAGKELDAEQCARLFSLPAIVGSDDALATLRDGGSKAEACIAEINHARETEILTACTERNGNFFDAEMGKLDKWAEDVKNSIEIELKGLDKEIKFRKTEAKKILNLEEKVRAQREIKDMEKTRNALRQNLFQSQDDIDAKKERLINEIEARLKQKVTKDRLFLVRWRVE